MIGEVETCAGASNGVWPQAHHQAAVYTFTKGVSTPLPLAMHIGAMECLPCYLKCPLLADSAGLLPCGAVNWRIDKVTVQLQELQGACCMLE